MYTEKIRKRRKKNEYMILSWKQLKYHGYCIETVFKQNVRKTIIIYSSIYGLIRLIENDNAHLAVYLIWPRNSTPNAKALKRIHRQM